ncbi:DUF2851 family protein [Luteibaculum oceani]|uniref:DUF2851 family protein n=1 Tax=Luteibaculum oceani TaxID=1294296 RepID=A0A5C6VB65_9FLAO|nr:DUF2851 family protein [Luteibaculum oceani]TXC81636.1 DUF2851 family protein [Luteibaculum oceani]
MKISEEFIFYVWKHRRFTSTTLPGVNGERITVKKPGILNSNAGPDFLHSEIEVDGRTWHGSVEIHCKASDWIKHQHKGDPKYNNLILHVVWENDIEIPELSSVPTLEIKSLVSDITLENYQNLQLPYQFIPCETRVDELDDFIVSAWLNRMLVERLEHKTKSIQDDYLNLRSNLNESFYRLMAKGFGQKINETGFDLLTRNLPLKIVLKHADKLADIEALLFGVAGLLNNQDDTYAQGLLHRYSHLKSKYGLEEISVGSWNYMRLRPANFPDVRIAQFAAVIAKSGDFLQLPNYTPDFKALKQLLSVKASVYWNNHYRFGVESDHKVKWISDGFFQHLLINVFVPFVFYYKRRTGGASFEWVSDILNRLPGEDNKVLRVMQSAGFENNTAGKSQSLYHLYNTYCSQSKCLSCAIGNAVLS